MIVGIGWSDRPDSPFFLGRDRKERQRRVMIQGHDWIASYTGFSLQRSPEAKSMLFVRKNPKNPKVWFRMGSMICLILFLLGLEKVTNKCKVITDWMSVSSLSWNGDRWLGDWSTVKEDHPSVSLNHRFWSSCGDELFLNNPVWMDLVWIGLDSGLKVPKEKNERFPHSNSLV